MESLVNSNNTPILCLLSLWYSKKINKLGHWSTSNSSRTQSYQFTYSPNHQEVNEHSKQGIKQWFATEVRATIFKTDQATEQKCDKILNDSFPIKKKFIPHKISHKIPQSHHS